MASASAGLPIRPHASGEADMPETEEELTEDLHFNEALLESLVDVTEDTSVQRAEIHSGIKTIKKKLKRLRAAKRGHTQDAASRMNGTTDARRSTSRKMNGSGNQSLPTMATPDQIIDLTETPPSSFRYPYGLEHDGYLGGSSSNDMEPNDITDIAARDRKRTYSSHLDAEDPWFPESKSRRTTPSLDENNFNLDDDLRVHGDASSTIDLTGDEEETSSAYLHRQEAEMHRLRLKKEQEEEDAWFAQQYAARLDNTDADYESDSVPNQATRFGQQRPSQSTHSYSQAQLPSTASSSSQPASGSSAFGLPSHVKPEPFRSTGYPDSSYQSTHAHGSKMPGSFDSDPLEEASRNFPAQDLLTLTEDDFDLFGDEAFSNAYNGSSPTPDSDLEIIGVGAAGFPPGSLGIGPSSQAYPSMGHRPGTLVNGSSRVGSSLSDIIGRTNNYDFATGRDHLGNPLPSHMMNRIQGLQNIQNGYIDAKSTEEQIRNLLTGISSEDANPDDLAETPEGFKYPLFVHQKIALKWMQGMEADSNKKGGILADDMGLGKTLSTLALIKTRPAPRNGATSASPTLIVAPVALLKQWEREIQTKITERPGLTVLNAHASRRNWESLRQYDIVLTTYDKIRSEAERLDKYTKQMAIKNSPADENFLMREFPLMGPRSKFHRVILDEAQAIKNAKAKRSQAIAKIRADYRWCLTGTPMMNSVSELASLVHFLRIKPYNDPKRWLETFGSLVKTAPRLNQHTGMKKLQALIKAIMLRRTKQTEINGKPIITLPPKTEIVDHIIFSEDEQSYYRDLERDSQVKFSRFLKEGLVGKRYTAALVLMLRLRQACCHPFLHITDLELVNNDIPVAKMLETAAKLKPDAVIRLKRSVGSFECPICYDFIENPNILVCGHNTCPQCLVRYRQTAEEQNIQNGREGFRSTCPECREAVNLDEYITFEIFQQVYMKDELEAERGESDAQDGDGELDEIFSDDETSSEEEGDDDEVDERGNLAGFIVDDDGDSDFSPVKHTKSRGKGKRKDKGKGKGKDEGKMKKKGPVKPETLSKLRKEATNQPRLREKYMKYLRSIWLDSAKVSKCMEIIASIQASGEKTIIFSQWTLLLDLLEVQMGRQLDIGFRRYDGSMQAARRDKAVSDFMEKPDVKVMLVSLKAGNAGLNLTAASHVIIMDPFWNPFTEYQAVDRAHRIGQLREVKVHRLLVKGTVEDRIIALQDQKRELVNSALDESASQAIGRLGAKDLAFLFGVPAR
ncbi:hypothetical protein JX265_004207 [Neoarthrinium moseri]|uniref:SWI/SNF family DNA-dependent ATPase Ris1 n=1 Tax=Neoarthrinium moseri TaxID=1658444 RepID=A0A9P9WQH4_9PEZI|nr:hypothetical protein JX265_004207 [Neoarthrinium moseri]